MEQPECNESFESRDYKSRPVFRDMLSLRTSTGDAAVTASEPSILYPTELVNKQQLTPSQQLATLLESMASQKNLLIEVLRFCSTPKPVSQVHALIEKIRENNLSVYAPSTICGILEKAGGLERVSIDGESLDSSWVSPTPIQSDGKSYIVTKKQEESCWLTTSAAEELVSSEGHVNELLATIQDNMEFVAVYECLLTLCDQEDEVSTEKIKQEVEERELLSNSHYFATRFINDLEQCNALVWTGCWKTSDTGRAWLQSLSAAKTQ